MDKTKSKQKIVRSVAALGGALLAAASAQGQPLASASSPHGGVEVEISLGGDGRAA